MNVNEERNKKAKQFTQILLSRKDFQNDVKITRKSWQIPEGGMKTGQEHADWVDNTMATSEVYPHFTKDITKRFIKSGKYGLSAAAWKPLLHYILDAKVPRNFNGALPVVIRTPEKNSGGITYSMRFYEHTTEAEIRKAFGDFKAANLRDKRQQLIPELKLKKMQRAYELRESKMAWKQIASVVNQELGGSLEYNDARKLVEQYKKQLHI